MRSQFNRRKSKDDLHVLSAEEREKRKSRLSSVRDCYLLEGNMIRRNTHSACYGIIIFLLFYYRHFGRQVLFSTLCLLFKVTPVLKDVKAAARFGYRVRDAQEVEYSLPVEAPTSISVVLYVCPSKLPSFMVDV